MKKHILMSRFVFCISLLFISIDMYSQGLYKPDSSVRTSVRQKTWQELKPLTPKKQQFLFGLVFKSDNYFKEYERTASSKGYNPYTIATVHTFFNVICEEIRDTKRYTDTDIKERFMDFSREEKDVALTNKQLQLKYDPMILKAMWLAQLSQSKNIDIETSRNLAKKLLEGHKIRSDQKKPKEVTKVKELITEKPASIKNNKKIHDVILRTVTSYGLGGVYVSNKVSVLYENGDVFTSPIEPLETFDILNSKKAKPTSWDRWKKRGAVIQVIRTKNKKVVDWKKWHKVRPASMGLKMQGKFNSIDAFGGSKVLNASTIYFDKQGRFAWKTIKGGNTVWKPVFTKNNASGRYEVNKFTITLKYNNGLSESFFFGLYPKDNLHFIIGANHFVPVKK